MATYSNRFLAFVLTLGVLAGVSGCTYDLVVRAGYPAAAGAPPSAVDGAVNSGDAGGSAAAPDGGRRFGSSANYAYAIGMGANSVPWAASFATPTLTQAAPTSDVATAPLLIQSQAPWASAATNLIPGNIVLNTPAPVGAGAPGVVSVQSGGTPYVAFGQLSKGSPYGAMWMANNASPTIEQNSVATYVNGPSGGTLYLGVTGAPGVIALTSTAFSVTQPTIGWASSVTAPALTEIAMASTSAGAGAAGQPLAVTAQAGQAATGAGNNGGAGGALTISSGNGGTSGSATAGGSGLLTLQTPLSPAGVTSSGPIDLIAGGSSAGALVSVDPINQRVFIQAGSNNVAFFNSSSVAFNKPIGGYSGNALQFMGQTSPNTVACGTGGTQTISAAQAIIPFFLVTTGTLTSNCIIDFGTNAVTGYFIIDVTGALAIGAGGFTIGFKNGSKTQTFSLSQLTAFAATGMTSMTVKTYGTNLITVGG